MTICASKEEVSHTLQRFDVGSLGVTFVLGTRNGGTTTSEDRARLFRTVEHAFHRIVFLCVVVNPEITGPLVAASLHNVFKGNLPCLTSLMIASAQPVGDLYAPLNALMNIVEMTSLELKFLYLENVSKDFILQACSMKFWKRLLRITIRNEFDSFDATIFSLSRNLEFLSFSGELVTPLVPYSPHLTTRIDFPKLQWLRVSLISMATLARLNLPKLHTMAIEYVEGNDPMPAPPPGTLCLPALTTLQIATVNPTIGCINAPVLETLVLSVPALKRVHGDKVLKEVFSGHDGMMKPRHLTFDGPVHDEYLIMALRHLEERLVSLQLGHQLQYGRAFWKAMMPKIAARHWFRRLASIVATFVCGSIKVDDGGDDAASPSSRGGYEGPLLPRLQCLVVTGGAEGKMPAQLRELMERRGGNVQCSPLLRLAWKSHDREVMEFVNPPLCDCAGGKVEANK